MEEYDKEEKFGRNAEIVEKIESGISFVKVAKEYGITKQRAHQIYKNGRPNHRELITLSEYCKLTGANRNTVINKFNRGEIVGQKIGTRYYVQFIAPKERACPVCKKPMEITKRACSPECYETLVAENRYKAEQRIANRLAELIRKNGSIEEYE
jgi:predicted nucleic acid-binding Zn ribbon protein